LNIKGKYEHVMANMYDIHTEDCSDIPAMQFSLCTLRLGSGAQLVLEEPSTLLQFRNIHVVGEATKSKKSKAIPVTGREGP
jgi:hypothetical protein